MMQLQLNKIYNEDCMETMKRMPDNYVDLVLTDPPYNVGYDYHDSISDDLSLDEYEKWCSEWLKEIYRVLKDSHYAIVFTGDINLFYVHSAIYKSGLKYHHMLKWFKPECQRSLPGTVLFGRTELAFVLSKNKPNTKLINRKILYQDTLIYSNTFPGCVGAVNHNAKRPVDLYRNIILGMTRDNDIIYDLFLGSGTTGIACIRDDRNFVGSEINPEYVEIANKRIKAEQDQTKLF